MKIVNCDCDAGCVEYEYDGRTVCGICPVCEGRGWYPSDPRDCRVEAWLWAWAN